MESDYWAWKTKKPLSLTPVETQLFFGELGTPYGVGVRLNGFVAGFHTQQYSHSTGFLRACQAVNKTFLKAVGGAVAAIATGSAGHHTAIYGVGVGGTHGPCTSANHGNAASGKNAFNHLALLEVDVEGGGLLLSSTDRGG